MEALSRRDFLVSTGGAAAAMALGPPSGVRSPAGPVILFQGDSITDWGRDRAATGPNLSSGLGGGYPLLVASAELFHHPERDLQFFNRAVSGNTVPDLDARWQADTIALRPDVLSILVGVNDYWHTLNGSYHGTVADYESGFAALLRRTRDALPAVRLVVLEPFVLRTGVVTEAWIPEFDQRRAVAARVAKAAGATFLPLQSMFDRLSSATPPAYWSADGVHPTPAGHAAITQAWMEAVAL